jgi:HEPN domain-containing protein
MLERSMGWLRQAKEDLEKAKLDSDWDFIMGLFHSSADA